MQGVVCTLLLLALAHALAEDPALSRAPRAVVFTSHVLYCMCKFLILGIWRLGCVLGRLPIL
jgi:hypothetical protein